MRVFKAFNISLLIYALFIWLYMTQFPTEKKLPTKLNNHLIKIDIRDIPVPEKTITKAVAKIKPVVKKPLAKPKKVVKQKVKETKVIKKKVIKKSVLVKKKLFKKKSSKKKIDVPKKLVKKREVEKRETTELEAFEREVLYIAEPMLTPQKKQPQMDTVSPWSYPNNKIRKLYGAGFHNFTPTQKQFIEDNLNNIQEITQRTLTRRGYPEGAGRTGQQGTNVVSFNLHPNGNISDLRLKTRIGYRALDENTLSLIRVAYMDYPYPSTTTKIIFYVTYSIY